MITFEQWLTEYCRVGTFDETEDWFNDLAIDGLNGPDDILMLMHNAYEAGWNACVDLQDCFTYEEIMEHEVGITR